MFLLLYRRRFLLIDQRYIRSLSIFNISKSCSRCNNMKIDKRIEKKIEIVVGGDDGMGSFLLIARVRKWLMMISKKKKKEGEVIEKEKNLIFSMLMLLSF